MLGLMQDWALTVDKILDHANKNVPNREIITRTIEGPIARTSYAALWRRAKQVTNALRASGVVPGDRVATLAWNTSRHLEAWFAVMGMGAILHTINPRLFPDQIAWIANHAGDGVLFVELSFLPLVEAIAPKIPSLKTIIVFCDGDRLPKTGLQRLVAYEDLIAGRPHDASWGGFDEQTAAGLCYTSGTTGDPKGVLYSHRSNVIHAMAANQPDCFGCGAADVMMPIVPMFHANAWAIPLVAPMCGAKLVLPGAKLDGASIHELLETEAVTFAAAVPTVWLMLLQHLRDTNAKLTSLKRVFIGGSAAPESLLRALEDDFGVEVLHAWGMTEMSPIGTVSKLAPEMLSADRDQQVKAKLKQGRPIFTVDLKVVDEGGREVERDGRSPGRLLVRGPGVSRAYFKNAGASNERGECIDAGGFFDTGDVATLDELGQMQITDRAKDVIKSGGEWISSIDIEAIVVGHAGVACAAVIGVAHPKWNERPLLILEAKPGAKLETGAVLNYLEGRVAKWWMPDNAVIVDKIPLGATGKINKLALREMFANHKLP